MRLPCNQVVSDDITFLDTINGGEEVLKVILTEEDECHSIYLNYGSVKTLAGYLLCWLSENEVKVPRVGKGFAF